MINEEGKKRIRLMTRIAIYEKEEGKKNAPVADYFRSDYIGLKILGAVLSASIIFCIVLGLYILCNSETLMIDFYKLDLMEEARKLIFYYVGFVASYVCIVAITFFVKYNKAVKYKRVYSKNLKKLLPHFDRNEGAEDKADDD